MFTSSLEATLRTLLKTTLALLLCSSPMLYAGSVTIGNDNGGNCYPFMCNDSLNSSGQSIDYQEAYNSSAFSGMTTINSLTYSWWSPFGVPNALGGDYAFYYTYSSVGLTLTTTLTSNYSVPETYLGTLVVPAGGEDDSAGLTFSGFTPFTYNPGNGDLLIEIVAANQDLAPNVVSATIGYNVADYTGTDVTRAYNISNPDAGAVNYGPDFAGTGALVTTFGTTGTVPEGGSSWLYLLFAAATTLGAISLTSRGQLAARALIGIGGTH
jgi:hypothetical protein